MGALVLVLKRLLFGAARLLQHVKSEQSTLSTHTSCTLHAQGGGKSVKEQHSTGLQPLNIFPSNSKANVRTAILAQTIQAHAAELGDIAPLCNSCS